jgi:hypothetical protein
MPGLSRAFFIPILMITTCSQSETPPADALAAAAPELPALAKNPTKLGECAERTICGHFDPHE